MVVQVAGVSSEDKVASDRCESCQDDSVPASRTILYLKEIHRVVY